MDRAVIHLDLDCFFVQVSARGRADLVGKPVVVTQHLDIITVNYEARKLGVQKHSDPFVVSKQWPEVTILHVPVREGGKVSYQLYREASEEVFRLLTPRNVPERIIVEKASIDEAYIDVTGFAAEKLKSEGAGLDMKTMLDTWPGLLYGNAASVIPTLNDPKALARVKMQYFAAQLAAEIRAEIKEALGFSMSAGIAQNKLLAKLASSRSKPSNQTAVIKEVVPELLQAVPLSKIPKLSLRIGKEGVRLLENELQVKYPVGLLKFTKQQLSEQFGLKSGQFLFDLARGEEFTPVKQTGLPNQFGVSMSLTPIDSPDFPEAKKVFELLAKEMVERLDKEEHNNKRRPRMLQFIHKEIDKHEVPAQFPITKIPRAGSIYSCEAIVQHMFELFNQVVKQRKWSLRWAGLYALKLEPIETSTLDSFFKAKQMATDSKEDNSSSSSSNRKSSDMSPEEGQPGTADQGFDFFDLQADDDVYADDNTYERLLLDDSMDFGDDNTATAAALESKLQFQQSQHSSNSMSRSQLPNNNNSSSSSNNSNNSSNSTGSKESNWTPEADFFGLLGDKQDLGAGSHSSNSSGQSIAVESKRTTASSSQFIRSQAPTLLVNPSLASRPALLLPESSPARLSQSQQLQKQSYQPTTPPASLNAAVHTSPSKKRKRVSSSEKSSDSSQGRKSSTKKSKQHGLSSPKKKKSKSRSKSKSPRKPAKSSSKAATPADNPVKQRTLSAFVQLF